MTALGIVSFPIYALNFIAGHSWVLQGSAGQKFCAASYNCFVVTMVAPVVAHHSIDFLTNKLNLEITFVCSFPN